MRCKSAVSIAKRKAAYGLQALINAGKLSGSTKVERARKNVEELAASSVRKTEQARKKRKVLDVCWC
jgi:hypothetical protein